MERCLAFLGLCVCAIGITAIEATNNQPSAGEILNRIRYNVNRDILPTSGNGPVNVTLGLDLLNLREVDVDRDEVELVGYLTSSWTDPSLTWERLVGDRAADTQAPLGVSIPIKDVWTPDITGYNYVTAPEVLSPKIVVWSPDGNLFYVPNLRVRFHCNLAYVETDNGANCSLKLGSWTHNGYKIDVHVRSNTVDLSDYSQNRQYELLSTSAKREVKWYPCCPEPFPDVKFTLTIRKRRSGGISLFDW